MAGNPRTKNGYSMFEMSSMIQKAIRRCDIPHAAYAAAELYPGYRTLLWNRLLTVSAEDCYGIMTREIMALAQADERLNGKKPADKANMVFSYGMSAGVCGWVNGINGRKKGWRKMST